MVAWHYLEAVESAFGAEIDYAMLVKMPGQPRDGAARYSPPECIGTQTHTIQGTPDSAHISTSYAEEAKPHDADGDAPVHPSN